MALPSLVSAQTNYDKTQNTRMAAIEAALKKANLRIDTVVKVNATQDGNITVSNNALTLFKVQFPKALTDTAAAIRRDFPVGKPVYLVWPLHFKNDSLRIIQTQ